MKSGKLLPFWTKFLLFFVLVFVPVFPAKPNGWFGGAGLIEVRDSKDEGFSGRTYTFGRYNESQTTRHRLYYSLGFADLDYDQEDEVLGTRATAKPIGYNLNLAVSFSLSGTAGRRYGFIVGAGYNVIEADIHTFHTPSGYGFIGHVGLEAGLGSRLTLGVLVSSGLYDLERRDDMGVLRVSHFSYQALIGLSF